MNPQLWLGEGLRWYLRQARHPFKDYLVGHYWRWLARPRVWIKYDGDATIAVTLSDYVQERIFFEGYYERALVDWLKRTLRPDDVFWDVGANIGAISIVASRLCDRVVAFEPDPRSLVLLNANLRANHIENVEVIPMALGATAMKAPLYQSATLNSGMTSLLHGRGHVVALTDVTVSRADDLVRSRPELAPSVMKVDVEGAEPFVFQGANGLLQTHRLRAIVFEDQKNSEAEPANMEIVTQLRHAGYQIQPLGSSDGSPDAAIYNFLATPVAA